MPKNILLIGRNPTVLANLDEALTAEGFATKMTNLVEQASQDFSGADFDLIAFGRGVDEVTNAYLRTRFSTQNPAVIFVDGLAPITSLLVQQIKLALADTLLLEKTLTKFTCQSVDCAHVQITVTAACQLTIELYQLDAVHHNQQTTLVSKFVTAGNHTFSVKLPDKTDSTVKFLVAQANNQDLMVLPLR